jgi:hypothetical protein
MNRKYGRDVKKIIKILKITLSITLKLNKVYVIIFPYFTIDLVFWSVHVNI